MRTDAREGDETSVIERFYDEYPIAASRVLGARLAQLWKTPSQNTSRVTNTALARPWVLSSFTAYNMSTSRIGARRTNHPAK